MPSRTLLWTLLPLSGLLLSACDDSESQAVADAGDVDPSTSADAITVEPQSGLTIELPDGALMGEMDHGARRFLKIPYAKPPVGDLRWRAPVPNDPWDGVRAESEFAAGCPQLADQGAPASDEEDCLYLNVWAPEPAPEDAPVVFWIHGGGNFSGAAGIPVPTQDDLLWYDGHVFAERHGVVVVTLNYRLGPLGFFAHPALAEEGEPAGNQGLLDQRLALEWVRDNIRAFGGDPGNVTIFGESAGSADVCYHVASPGSWGLFHRAIGQSGGCTIRSVGPERTPQSAGEQMVAYGEALGCEAGDDQLDCMREVGVGGILDNAMQPAPGDGEVREATWQFAAIIDGPGGFLPDDLKSLFDAGEIADVPYLLGANHDEGTTFLLRAEAIETEAQFMADLEMRFPGHSEEIAEVYAVEDGDYNTARMRVVGESGVLCSTHDTARRAARAGRDVYMYDFNVAWAIAPTLLFAGHAAEISHVFGTPYIPEGMPDPDSEAVAEGMNAYWAHFAKTGDPNFEGAPAEWPLFDPDDDKRLQLDADWSVLSDFRTEECALWRKLAGVD